MNDPVERTLRELLSRGDLALPDPGAGATAQRLLTLFELARTHPVAVARLAEAHTDAVAILHEAGRRPEPGSLYGVWASAGPDDTHLTAGVDASPAGGRVSGIKPFASGLGVVDRALVTATDGRSGLLTSVLLDVPVRTPSIRCDLDRWVTDALRDSATGAAEFLDVPVADGDIVGRAGWYLDRVGFWHGACAPAACWAGAVAGLLDAAEARVDDDPHRRAHLGAMRCTVWAMRALVSTAGDEIDRWPDEAERAQARAIAVRSTIERLATDVLDRFGRAFGPRPFTSDADVSQRWADSHLYLRQHHGERDLAAAGELSWPG
jgi:alkylation response protein AidB-like acyl-CoA dehydrogenase